MLPAALGFWRCETFSTSEYAVAASFFAGESPPCRWRDRLAGDEGLCGFALGVEGVEVVIEAPSRPHNRHVGPQAARWDIGIEVF